VDDGRQGEEVSREGIALETPTTVLVVGGLPGRAYTAPPFALDRPTESG
jgi:hypothetical protein